MIWSMNEKDKTEKLKENTPVQGVFITQGMQVSIPQFSIRIGPDGKIEAETVTLHRGIDLCPYWLDIAYEHLLCTEKASKDLLDAKKAEDNERIANALRAEFIAGMQAIMASAIAIDAYYACVKERIEIPEDLTRTWREKRTARYKQIAELLRRAFPMSQKSAKQLREILKQNMGFRDKTIHPVSGTTAPALHPALNKVTDWRYVTFRYYNAKAIAGLTLSIIAQTAGQPHKDKFNAVRTYCETLMSRVEPLLKRWDARYGKLFG
jgi:hypothetical protein